MEFLGFIAGSCFLGGAAMIVLAIRHFSVVSSRNFRYLVEEGLPEAVKNIPVSHFNDEAQVLERLESVERRMEKVHKDALRYLQKGAQHFKKADELRGIDPDDDGEVEVSQEQLLAGLQAAQGVLPAEPGGEVHLNDVLSHIRR